MAGFANIIALIRKKILAFQMELAELKSKTEILYQEKTGLEKKLSQVNEELRLSIQENKDLKEIVYEATRENAQFKSQIGKVKPGSVTTPSGTENSPATAQESNVYQKSISRKELEQLESKFYNYDADENNFDEEEINQ